MAKAVCGIRFRCPFYVPCGGWRPVWGGPQDPKQDQGPSRLQSMQKSVGQIHSLFSRPRQGHPWPSSKLSENRCVWNTATYPVIDPGKVNRDLKIYLHMVSLFGVTARSRMVRSRGSSRGRFHHMCIHGAGADRRDAKCVALFTWVLAFMIHGSVPVPINGVTRLDQHLKTWACSVLPSLP